MTSEPNKISLEQLEPIAKSVASMVIEWVDSMDASKPAGGDLDWRPGLEGIIHRRLYRLFQKLETDTARQAPSSPLYTQEMFTAMKRERDRE